MKITSYATNKEILSEIGRRLRRYRLQQNTTQDDLARRSGVHPRTIRNAEAGGEVELATIVRLIRALGRVDAIDAFLPEPKVSPMEILKTGGRERQRARKG